MGTAVFEQPLHNAVSREGIGKGAETVAVILGLQPDSWVGQLLPHLMDCKLYLILKGGDKEGKKNHLLSFFIDIDT